LLNRGTAASNAVYRVAQFYEALDRIVVLLKKAVTARGAKLRRVRQGFGRLGTIVEQASDARQ